MADRLEDWVREHHVCWELSAARGDRVHGDQGALELTLLARCVPGRALNAGDPECEAAYAQLVGIADRVLPTGLPHHLEPYDAALHLRPESAFAAEVELVVEAFPVQTDVSPARRALEAGLRRLGVQARAWSDAATARV